MTELPGGWTEVALGDVCQVVSGATPKTEVADYWGGDIRWLTPNDLSKDRSQTLHGGERTITQAGYDSCSARLFPAGSVIVSSRAPVGYVAIAGVEMCTNQGCKTAIPPEYIDSKYLYWYLLAAKPDLEARASGTTFKEISGKRFAETRLRFPHLDEQHRIVELLEDHLSRLDAATESIRVSLRRLDVLRRLVVKELAVGDLVPLKQLALDSGYGTSVKCEVGGAGPAVVRIPNLVSGRIDLADEKRAIDPTTDLASAMLAPGDVLIIRTNGSKDLIGRSGVVQEGVDAAFASYLIRYQVDSGRLRPEWLHTMLGSPALRAEIERLAASSAGQHNLSLGKLDSLLIPTPSLESQDAGLARLAELDEHVGALGRPLVVSLRRGEGLRRSLLAAAFSGRLTGASVDGEAA